MKWGKGWGFFWKESSSTNKYRERILILVTFFPLLLNIQTIIPFEIKYPHKITLIRNIQTRSWKNIKQKIYWANHVLICDYSNIWLRVSCCRAQVLSLLVPAMRKHSVSCAIEIDIFFVLICSSRLQTTLGSLPSLKGTLPISI